MEIDSRADQQLSLVVRYDIDSIGKMRGSIKSTSKRISFILRAFSRFMRSIINENYDICAMKRVRCSTPHSPIQLVQYVRDYVFIDSTKDVAKTSEICSELRLHFAVDLSEKFNFRCKVKELGRKSATQHS